VHARGDLPEAGVHEPGRALSGVAHRGDRAVHRRERGDAVHEEDLIETRAQRREDARRWQVPPGAHRLDDAVQEREVAAHAEDDLPHEADVEPRQALAFPLDQGRQAPRSRWERFLQDALDRGP
jgi:hypothetical protein